MHSSEEFAVMFAPVLSYGKFSLSDIFVNQQLDMNSSKIST